MKIKTPRPFAPSRLALVAAAAAAAVGMPAGVGAADIDIYGGTVAGAVPNVVFLLDNTSNWSSNNQGWNSTEAWTKARISSSGGSTVTRPACKDLSDTVAVEAAEKAQCKSIIEQIFYTGTRSSLKRPWEAGYQDKSNADRVDLTQGQVQLRALKLVLNSLVCSGKTDALSVNVGISMIGDTGSVLSNGHSTGFMRFAVQKLAGTAATADSTCKKLIDDLDLIDSKITNPTFKAPSSANYGAAYYEIFKYFGGHTNPTLAATSSDPVAGSPTGATGYGPIRYSNLNPLDDPAAFTGLDRTTYQSPITATSSCAGNFIVLVGNTYPNAEPSGGGPTYFSGIDYKPPTLSAVTSDTSRLSDEWSHFLANTDVSPISGVQKVFSYTVNTYKDKPDADQGKLLKSMAAVGGVGSAGYLEVGGDLVGLVDAFERILTNIAAVNSVFTAATLPVSTTTRGTYLNQIFVGMFRPDADGNPRWMGNLKQYELGYIGGTLDLVDVNGNSAVLGGSGFFSPTAKSYWTTPSVFFTNLPSGTPPSASDSPDGAVVEKGGVAQKLRESTLLNRNIYAQPSVGSALSSALFKDLPTTAFTADEIAWVRGEANVTTGDGQEQFVGAYTTGGNVKNYGTTGPRHSIHGDVLHSRPLALNYGGGDVVVFYGSNDGLFRAVDGNKTGTTAGQELWAFVAPEHYPMMKRLRTPAKLLLLPETDSSGNTITSTTKDPKDYAMDGPIGSYVRYASGGGSLTEAFLFAGQRRGGKNVYAFDVTAKTNPKLLWKISGGSGDFSKLAQTWSMPKAVTFASSSSKPPVILFMGGGYDPAEDKNDSSGIGNVVYIVNGRTGALLKELSTEYSVPSDVTIVDVNGDGVPDRGYVADVRGNLYRIDIPSTGDLEAAATWSSVAATKIAALEGKVFFAPDVVPTSRFVSIQVGTGDREKPLLSSTSDRFYLIKDNVGAAGTTVTRSDLTRIARIDNGTMKAADVTAAAADAKGCYIDLATNGEKVVNAAFTIAGTTYFGTNRPKPTSSTSCSGDLGEAYSYKFPLFCGAPSSTKIVGGGLPPSPVGGIVEIKVPCKTGEICGGDGFTTKRTPFIIGAGTGGSAFKPEDPTPNISRKRTRTNWYIDNTNR